LVSNIGNPKIAVFFSSLLPQFVGGDAASFASLLALGLLFCALGLIWLTSYALVLDRADAYLRRSAVRRIIEAVTGCALIGLALRLATARR
jgi:threonine/homoserine/homoserine lactone efflux protein